MEQRRSLVHFFTLFLMLSSLLLLPSLNSAVPLSRSVALKNRELTAVEVSDDQIPKHNENLKDKMARREIETNDYPGSGANPRHDPRSPGRA